MRIVVTGASGFIGSHIIEGLRTRGLNDIIEVDSHNKDSFYDSLEAGTFGTVDVVFHMGACSDTMETDKDYMMKNNYFTSRDLLNTCTKQGIRLIYASSAAVYGDSGCFYESAECERPMNIYGHSKLLFDEYVRLQQTPNQVVGLRYFNVYGGREQNKGRMASVAYNQLNQFQKDGKITLFGEYGGYEPGEHCRDFVFIDDVVAINLWFFDHPEHSGIFNVGSGRAQPFNDVALAIINTTLKENLTLQEAVDRGLIEYVPMPTVLRGKYQCYTKASLINLHAIGCNHEFVDVKTGISRFWV